MNKFLCNNKAKDKDYLSILLSKKVTKDQRAILTKLHEYGIKEYISKHFNDDQCDGIDLLYQLTRQHFHNQLAKITSLHHHGDDQSATTENKTRKEKEEIKNNNIIASRFWSCDDIVIKAFQYLNLSSLNACSLVCINFLTHSYNPNSIYRLIIRYEPKSDGNSICLNAANNMRLRDWKRFSNCKHLDLMMWNNTFGDNDKNTFSPTFINGVLSLKHMVIFNCRIGRYGEQVVDFIEKLSHLDSILKNIKEFTFCVKLGFVGKFGSELDNYQFNLENCEKCVLSKVYFKVILSNKCHHLALNYNILKKNFDYRQNDKKDNKDKNISLSDLSGVKTLILKQIEFDEGDNPNPNWLKAMCSQFSNLNKLKIYGFTNATVFCWEGLMAIIKANQGHVLINSNGFSIVNGITNQNRNLIADDITVNVISHPNPWKSITDAKLFLKYPSVSRNLNSLTVTAKGDANDALNGFFHILKMDAKTNYSIPLTRQLAPHEIFSKLESEEDLKQHGVLAGNANKCLVGWRVEHGNHYDNYNGIVGRNSNSDNFEAIIKVQVCMISKKKKLFLHYRLMEKYFGTGQLKGGWHHLPNDNLYPANFVGSKYRLISNLNVDWPYWYDNALKLNCIRVQSDINGKQEIDIKTLDNIVSYMIIMNQWKVKKQEVEQKDNKNKIWRIGINVSCCCNTGMNAEIATNLFKNIRKLILMCIPINFYIVIITKDKVKKKLISDSFSLVFDNINQWYTIYIPQCDYAFWKVLNTAKITFDSSGKYFHIQTAEEI